MRKSWRNHRRFDNRQLSKGDGRLGECQGTLCRTPRRGRLRQLSQRERFYLSCGRLAIQRPANDADPRMSAEVQFDEKAVCDRCGKFGAFQFDGQKLCAECYESQGSCCPEFGADDKWNREIPKTELGKPK
jgi:hypothetical protein